MADSHNYQLPPGSRWREMVFWSPVLGCSPVSEGCLHCSSAKHVEPVFVRSDGREPHFNGHIEFDEATFTDVEFFDDNEQVFVCGCSDMFHEKVPIKYSRKIMSAARQRPDCTFFALTKRAERLAKACKKYKVPKNFWLGITVESQKHVERIRAFKGVEAIRVISAKPLLSDINLLPYKGLFDMVVVGGEYNYYNLDWSRPMSVNWVRSLRDQCLKMKVPFSFHNWGSWMPCRKKEKPKQVFDGFPMKYHNNDPEEPYLIDGKMWDEYPNHC